MQARARRLALHIKRRVLPMRIRRQYGDPRRPAGSQAEAARVIWWKRHIGDWRAKTAHLSSLEKGIYGELLDHAYATQTPLPRDIESNCRIAGATSAMETRAVEQVLKKCWELTPDGYVNKRVEEEIAKYEQKAHNKSVSAAEAWAKRKASNVLTMKK